MRNKSIQYLYIEKEKEKCYFCEQNYNIYLIIGDYTTRLKLCQSCKNHIMLLKKFNNFKNDEEKINRILKKNNESVDKYRNSHPKKYKAKAKIARRRRYDKEREEKSLHRLSLTDGYYTKEEWEKIDKAVMDTKIARTVRDRLDI